MNGPTGRRMIRLDEPLDVEQTSESNETVDLPETQQVIAHECSDPVRTREGFRYQKCGGGRRRLPHKGGY